MNKTRFLTKVEAENDRKWHIVDATAKPLGRIASEIAVLLRGKHKPTFTPHNDNGDFVVVVNAEKITLSGNKMKDKMYYSHSGYVGGLREQSAQEIMNKYPERLVEKAVRRMLPKTKLGNQIAKKLKVYVGEDHPHAAQQPQVYTPKYI